MRTIILAAALVFAAPAFGKDGPAASPQLNAADPAAIVERWEKAWNAHDPAAWADLFHEDATWILWTGAEWHGRAAILAGITGPFRTFYAASTQLSRPVEIRLLAPGVAVARTRTTLTGDTRQPGATIHGNKLLILTRRDNAWRILYGQNTRLTDAEAAKVRPSAALRPTPAADKSAALRGGPGRAGCRC